MQLRVYKPFLDGVIGYDCAECRSGCCRAGNLGSTPAERRNLVSKYPSLALFAERVRDEGHNAIMKGPPACWFLRDDGLCSIHSDHGMAAKPLTCRSHPLYIRRFGANEAWVTAHYVDGCVWRVDDSKPRIASLQWAEADALAAETVVLEGAPLPDAPWPATSGVGLADLFPFEERVRDAALDHDSFEAYLDAQDQLTANFMQRPSPATWKDQIDLLLADSLGITTVPGPELGQLMKVASPLQRAHVMGLSLPTPAMVFPEREILTVLPRYLYVLYRMLGVYESVSPSRRAPLSLSTVSHLTRRHAHRYLALACAGFALVARDPMPALPASADLPRSQAFIDVINAGEGLVTFGDHIRVLLASVPLDERAMYLDAVGRMLWLFDISPSA